LGAIRKRHNIIDKRIQYAVKNNNNVRE